MGRGEAAAGDEQPVHVERHAATGRGSRTPRRPRRTATPSRRPRCGPRSARRTARSRPRTGARRARRRGSAGTRRGSAGSRGRRSPGDVATTTDRSNPGTRSRRKRWYSRTWRRPSTSARVSCSGSVASTFGIRVMWISATPSYGVRCHDPSIAREAVLAGPRRLGHQGPQLVLGDAAGALDVDVRELEQRRQRLDRLRVRGRVVRDAGHRRDVRVAGRVHEHGRLDPALAALVPQPDRPQPRPSSTRTPVAQVWSSSSTPASSASRSQRTLSASMSYVTPVPAPYVFGRSNATPSAVEPPHDLPAEPADHPPGLLAGRVERVERVEDGGRGAAHERRAGRRSSVRAPRRAAVIAADEPAEPDPTTTTSNRSFIGAGSAPGSSRAGFATRIRAVASSPIRRRSRGTNVRHQVAQPRPAARRRAGSSAPRGPAPARAGRGGRRRRPARSGRGRRCPGGTSSGRRCRTRA